MKRTHAIEKQGRTRRRPRRGSTLAAWAFGLGSIALVLLLLDGARLAGAPRRVTALGLTDPALFTEARYARHASQADRHAAFQDHPMALEHFPAGSLMPPPVAPGSRLP